MEAASVNALTKLATTLDKAKCELDLAREQATKPKHLHVCSRRAAVQAARAVIAAIDRGYGIPPGSMYSKVG
jgi:hypothetical protein